MHDVGPQFFDECSELVVRAEVLARVDFADEVWDLAECDGLCGPAHVCFFGSFVAAVVEGFDAFAHGTFWSEDRSEGEVDVVAEACLSFAGEDGVFLASAEYQSC